MPTISIIHRSVLQVAAPNGSMTQFGMVDTEVDGKTWVLLVERNDNAGPSITNNSEHAVQRAKAHILQRTPWKVTFAEGDSFFEAYEYRMQENGGIDPHVTQIVNSGGAWIAVSRDAIARLDTPLCILMRCWDEAYFGSPEMEADIEAARVRSGVTTTR